MRGRLVTQSSTWRRRAVPYLRTPKGRLLALFVVLATAGATHIGFGVAATVFAVGVGSAVAVDVALRWMFRREWAAPTGAVLTGVDAALVLSPFGTWLALPAACATGIIAKHVFRTRSANIFNPSAFGMVCVSVLLGRGLSWWGSLPDYALPGLALLALAGVVTADHVNKLPLVLSFLVTYFVSFDLLGLALGGGRVAEIFDAPETHAVLFFAVFMLTDPPTSPVRYFDQLWYGPLVALLATTIFIVSGASYFLPGALLIANLAEAVRRARQARRRQSTRGRGTASPGRATWSPFRPRSSTIPSPAGTRTSSSS